jgi:deoxycytidylate deaminase
VSLIDRGFEAAFAASELSDAPRAGLRMGAALFSGSRMLSVGANLYRRTHPASAQAEGFAYSTHCEHVALLRRQHYDTRSRLTLYVARRLADGTVGNSRPCINCMNLCKLAGVTRIWFYEYGQRKETTL